MPSKLVGVWIVLLIVVSSQSWFVTTSRTPNSIGPSREKEMLELMPGTTTCGEERSHEQSVGVVSKFPITSSQETSVNPATDTLETRPLGAERTPVTLNDFSSPTDPDQTWVYEVVAINQEDAKPKILVDSEGNSHVAWVTASGIYYAWWTDQTGWSASQVTSTVPTDYEVEFILNSTADPHFAWEYDLEIYYTTGRPGSWTTTQVTSNSIEDHDPSLDIDSADIPHLAWWNIQSGYGRIQYAHESDGAWSVSQLPTSTIYDYQPSLKIDFTGKVHIAFTGNIGANTEIYYGNNASGAWSAERLTDDAEYDYEPILRFNNPTRPHILSYSGSTCYLNRYYDGSWHEYSFSKPVHYDVVLDSEERVYIVYDSYCRTNSEGSPDTWTTQNLAQNLASVNTLAFDAADKPHLTLCTISPYEIIHMTVERKNWDISEVEMTGSNQIDPEMVMNPSGVLRAVWAESRPDYEVVYGAYDGHQWSTFQVTDNSAADEQPELAFDSSGNPHIVWCSDADGNDEIFYATNATGTWTTTQLTMNSGWNPKLAVDSYGYVHILYQGAGAIYHATNAGGTWTIQEAIPSASNPLLAIDASDRLILAYTTTYYTYIAVYDGSSWDSTLVLSGRIPSQMILDDKGRIHLVWCANNDAVYYTWNGSYGWETERVSSPSSISYHVGGSSIAVDSDGNPFIAWQEYGSRINCAKRCHGNWSIVRIKTDTSLLLAGAETRIVLDNYSVPRIVWEPNVYESDSFRMTIPQNALPSEPVIHISGDVDNDGSFQIDWSESGDQDGYVTEYELEMATDSFFVDVQQQWAPSSTNQTVSGVANGFYYFRVHAIDNEGGSSPWSNVVNITIDTTLPLVTILEPLNSSYLAISTIAVTIMIADVNPENASLFVNNSLISTLASGWTWNDVSLALGDGMYNLTVRAFAFSDNVQSTTIWIILDKTPPTIIITNPGNGTITLVPQIDVAISPADANLANASLYVNNTLVSTQSTGWVWISVDLTLGDGNYSLRVVVIDKAGNQITTIHWIHLDTPPDIFLLSPSSDSFVNVSVLAVRISIIDLNPKNATLFVNGTSQGTLIVDWVWSGIFLSLGDGRYNLSLIAFDQRDQFNKENWWITLDTVIPELSLSFPENGTFLTSPNLQVNAITSDANFASLTLYINDTAQNSTTSQGTISFSTILTVDGQYTVTLVARDLAGNIKAFTIFCILDTIPPSLQVTFPINPTNNPSQMIVVSTDGAFVDLLLNGTSQGIQTSLFRWNITLIEGVNNITIIARDAAGNMNASSGLILLDTTIPNLSVEFSEVGLTNQRHITVSAASNAIEVELYLNGTSQGAQTTDFIWNVILQEGVNNLTIIARSGTGSFAQNVEFITSDTTLPRLEILGLSAGQVLNGIVNVSVNSTDKNGVTRVEFWIDSILQDNSTTTPYQFSWDTHTNFDGSHIVIIKSYDAAGNIAIQEFQLWVNNSEDLTPPTVGITGISNGTEVSGVVRITVTASDPSGIFKVEFYIDGVLSGVDSSPPYEFEWDTTETSKLRTMLLDLQQMEGLHELRILTYDGVGNTHASLYIVQVVPTISPHEEEGVEFPWLWLLLLVVLGLLVAVVGGFTYIYSSEERKRRVHKLFTREPGIRHLPPACPYCGMPLEETQTKCPDCRRPIPTCAVCRRGLWFGDSIAECNRCHNQFHETHLLEALKVQGVCPICRETIGPDEVIIRTKIGKGK